MVQYIINYLDSDTVLFQSNEDDELYSLQVKEWDPVVQWFCDKFQVNISKSRSMQGLVIDQSVKNVISKYLLSYDFPAVHGFVYAADTVKSIILTIACVEKYLTPEKGVLLSRLEEEFQLGKWGRVEWAHDLNQQDLQARFSAAILLITFSSSSWLTKAKSVKL
ncbi:ATP synthase mitochondrial F1 complex assembly factor 2 [Agrilus planipennis]|uniref:ATP synthase mitochondrial F1 complex assembly factor 2 n=1 Tax=Agrilus planipennis TaxID=224129 RepID=A0A1W4WDD1_AGRPL|nr:ATP synthase mitochondrial F1 complex assembly factor 2 [Agrilus planipennis]